MIERSFFQRDTLKVAQELIGMELVSTAGGKRTSGIIVETEAYMGAIDRAAHSFRGRTNRVRALYGEKGHVYIYFNYGMYWCLNFSAGDSDAPECILIRALEPKDGIDTMIERRGTDKLTNLASGPGKLTIALGLNGDVYGADVCDTGSVVYIEGGESLPFDVSKRVGIDNSGEAKNYMWRFTARGSKFLSRPVIL